MWLGGAVMLALAVCARADTEAVLRSAAGTAALGAGTTPGSFCGGTQFITPDFEKTEKLSTNMILALRDYAVQVGADTICPVRNRVNMRGVMVLSGGDGTFCATVPGGVTFTTSKGAETLTWFADLYGEVACERPTVTAAHVNEGLYCASITGDKVELGKFEAASYTGAQATAINECLFWEETTGKDIPPELAQCE